MSRRRTYSAYTLAIMDRFFQALQAVIDNKLVKNVAQYCRMAGIESSHYYNQRADRSRGYFEVSWMLPLVLDFGISANWLLTGKGTMFVA